MAQVHAARLLTVADAETVVRELERAAAAHHHWINRFQGMLVSRTQPDPEDLGPDGHMHCEFGDWYRELTNAYLRHHPDFPAIGKYHQEMHAVARSLAETVGNGADIAPAQYQAFADGVGRFQKSIEALLAEARVLLRSTDPLTGVANRLAMMTRLEAERQRAHRTHRPCSIGMVDLDRFKEINDQYGHRTGDAVLRGVARFLLDNIRKSDEVSRYGGEEFVLMLPDTPPERAKGMLDRLRRGLKKHPIRVESGRTFKIRASFGIAALDRRHSVMTAIGRADLAMYAAKKAGRDRVRVWTEEPRRRARPKAPTAAARGRKPKG